MLDIGFQEMLVLMVIALVVFGPDKLPELGRRLGRAMREFRRASDEFRSTIETNLNLHEEPPLPPSSTASFSTPTGESTPPTGDAAPVSGPATVMGPPTSLESDGAGTEAAGVAALALIEPFCARRGGRLLHRSPCGWAGRIPDSERIALKTASEGWELGLHPCPVCDPREGEGTS
jgi:TatA/E family protein of Tat protein translocase